jgi:hypothetical protein
MVIRLLPSNSSPLDGQSNLRPTGANQGKTTLVKKGSQMVTGEIEITQALIPCDTIDEMPLAEQESFIQKEAA